MKNFNLLSFLLLVSQITSILAVEDSNNNNTAPSLVDPSWPTSSPTSSPTSCSDNEAVCGTSECPW